MKEFFSDIMGLPVSEGGIHNILKRITKKALPFYLQIKERIKGSDSVGSDETGVKVNGKKQWFWTWQNTELTFVVHSDCRGFKTIENTFENGLPLSVIQHDRWPAHFQCIAKDHQICIAHLLRDLNFIVQLEKSQWAVQLKTLLCKAIEFKKEMTAKDYYPDAIQPKAFEQNLNELLLFQLTQSEKKARTLQKQLLKNKLYILAFLRYPKVPPDNNGSERAIRNVKVQQKISGQFKSIEGAQGFAIVRSVIDTILKSGQNVIEALRLIARLGY